MKRIAGYIRVSRVRTDDAISPENQKEKILEHARRKNVPDELIDFYIDLDYSGKNVERPEFQRMMANLDKYSHVIVYKLSRFSRSTSDFHTSIEMLEKANVDLVSHSEDIDTSTPVGRLVRNVLVDFAQFEREIIAEQVKDNMHVNASKGNWNGGSVPYGLDWVDKSFMANDKMENVRYIFETISTGSGANVVRNYFFSRGIKSPTGKQKWSKNTILNIARNPVYCGQLRYGGKVHEGNHKEYIDRELFDNVQTVLGYRSEAAPRTIGSEHLLSSLIKCSSCGKPLHIRYNGKSHNPVRRYVCPGRNDYTDSKCFCPILDADSLENAVSLQVLNLADDQTAFDNMMNDYKSLAEAKKPEYEPQIKRFKKELDRIGKEMFELVKALRKGLITEEQFAPQNKELLDEEKSIREELEKLEYYDNLVDSQADNVVTAKLILKNLKTIWEHATPQEKRRFIDPLIKQIIVRENGVEVDYYFFKLPIEYKQRTKTTMEF